MKVLAIDPGSEQSAWLFWDTDAGAIAEEGFGIEKNGAILLWLRWLYKTSKPDVIVLEQVRSYGMPVGKEVFDTVFWTGRFAEAAIPVPVELLPRKTVVIAICGSARAKDANVRQALLDRVGPAGTKKDPGPTYGISRDVWSALAIAVAWAEGAR